MRALTFNGLTVTDRVRLPSGMLPSSGPLAFGCWVRFRDTSSYYALVSLYINDADAFEIFLDGSPKLFGGNYNTAAYSAVGSIVAERWHRIVLASDGSVTQLYVDGVPSGSTGTLNFSATSRASTPYIGSRGTQYYLHGDVGDVTLWLRPFGATDARVDYELSAIGYPGLLRRRPSAWATDRAAGGGGTYKSWFAGSGRGSALGGGGL